MRIRNAPVPPTTGYCSPAPHLIVQDRIKGLNFKIGVFTNISHDHLNYHKTFKNYIEAKKIFFDNLSSKAVSLYNSDDKNGRIMIQNTPSKIKSFSIHKNSDYKIKIVENNLEGLVFEIQNNILRGKNIVFCVKNNVCNIEDILFI